MKKADFILTFIVITMICTIVHFVVGCASDSQERWPYKGDLRDNSGQTVHDPKWNAINQVR